MQLIASLAEYLGPKHSWVEPALVNVSRVSLCYVTQLPYFLNLCHPCLHLSAVLCGIIVLSTQLCMLQEKLFSSSYFLKCAEETESLPRLFGPNINSIGLPSLTGRDHYALLKVLSTLYRGRGQGEWTNFVIRVI